MADISLNYSSRAPFAGSFAGPLGTLGQVVSTWRGRARMRRELARLDHRMMRDLALNPGDIEFEISKPFWRA